MVINEESTLIPSRPATATPKVLLRFDNQTYLKQRRISAELKDGLQEVQRNYRKHPHFQEVDTFPWHVSPSGFSSSDLSPSVTLNFFPPQSFLWFLNSSLTT